MTAKISISLPADDLAVLDALIEDGIASGRSEAIRFAIGRVRESALEAHLAQQLLATFDEPETQELIADWDATAGDGL
jgi:Arc/MetJ-type ribon-helix-helix transcriptional regulator